LTRRSFTWRFGEVYTQLVEAIYWAGSIVRNFDAMPNALCAARYAVLLSTGRILTARRY
jgi:hypothetical protein